MTSEADVPDDFPRMECYGAVPGAQVKFLAQLIDAKFIAVLPDEELWERYEACEGLAQQFASYVSHKCIHDPPSLGDVLDCVNVSMRKKVSLGDWVLSTVEIGWITNRLRLILADGGVL